MVSMFLCLERWNVTKRQLRFITGELKFRHACVMESIHLFTCLCISPGAYNLGCLYMRMYRGAKNSDLSEAAAFKAKAVDSFLLAARLGDMWVSGELVTILLVFF